MRTLNYYYKKILISIMVFCCSTLFVSSLFSLAPRKVAASEASQAEKAPATGETRMDLVRIKSLEREQTIQEKKAGIDNRTLQDIAAQTTPNTYTQTEGYFQIPAMRELVMNTFDDGSYKPIYHMDVISRVIAKEAALNDTHWVFYHAHVNDWILPQEVFKELNNHFKPNNKAGNDFIFLRFTDQELPRAKEFLEEHVKESGLIDDNGTEKGMILSANLSLFGNSGFKGECTWYYFMTPVAHEKFNRAILEGMMTKFGVTHKYIDELLELIDDIRTKTQTLVQIFIPKNMVDDIGYLSFMTGIPAHEDTIEWVRKNVKNKKYKAKLKEEKSAMMVALEDLQQKFQKQREKNPLYKDIINSVDQGDYSVDAALRIYCNKPWELPNLNYLQARLVLSSEMLLNPHAGIKLFRHTKIKRHKMEAFKKRVREIVQKIISEPQ